MHDSIKITFIAASLVFLAAFSVGPIIWVLNLVDQVLDTWFKYWGV